MRQYCRRHMPELVEELRSMQIMCTQSLGALERSVCFGPTSERAIFSVLPHFVKLLFRYEAILTLA